MEKYFRVGFKAQLLKFSLAFKADCQIEVFWKKGEKIAQSGKVKFSNAAAYFNETLAINSNMVYDGQARQFKEKVTKFEIVLSSEKGMKKVGESRFDVSGYLNDRLKTPKEYEVLLDKCPDKNSKLSFKLSASIQNEISPDLISNSSGQTVNVEQLVNGQVSAITKSSILKTPQGSSPPTKDVNVPTKDVNSPSRPPNAPKALKRVSSTTITSIESSVSYQNSSSDQNSVDGGGDKVKRLEKENREIRQKIKNKERLQRQNQQLRQRLKNESFPSVSELKAKIDNGRKELQKSQGMLRKKAVLQKEVKQIQEEILHCKYKIMMAFNYANETGGKVMFEMQEACGLQEK